MQGSRRHGLGRGGGIGVVLGKDDGTVASADPDYLVNFAENQIDS
jgi:hypothetical protein